MWLVIIIILLIVYNLVRNCKEKTQTHTHIEIVDKLRRVCSGTGNLYEKQKRWWRREFYLFK